MGKLFGTDGVRGVANKELTPELAYELGVAGTHVLSKDKENPVIIIGKDTRISGDMLEDALSAGILSTGGNVIKVGVIPTPAVAYLVRYYNADAGVVISASHNPFEYNGIKFFNSEGFKLEDSIEREIENIILNNVDVNSHIVDDAIGKSMQCSDDALNKYVDFLLDAIDINIKGMKIVVDCANGASHKAAKMVFDKLGADVLFMGNEPDGININLDCGSTSPEKLQKTVIDSNADMGLAFDGDADRLIAVDENGEIIDGDKIMYICAKQMKKEDNLRNDMVTATVMSNIGLEKALTNIGCHVQFSGVGDRYVLEMMKNTGSVLGGEQSGHIIFLENNTTGDGLFAALNLLNAIEKSGKKASELSNEIRIYPQVLVNAKVKNENKRVYEDDKDIATEIKKIEDKMQGNGRVLIRPSGTEPLVRVMLEGDDYDEMKIMADNLADLITDKLGE